MGEYEVGKKYSVIFTGKIIDGLDVNLVKSNLSAKLKISNEKIEALFAKAPRVLKKYETFEESVRLITLIKSCGAIAEIKEKKNKTVNLEKKIDNKKESLPESAYQKTREHEEKGDKAKKGKKKARQQSVIVSMIISVLILSVIIWVAWGYLFGEPDKTNYPNSIEDATIIAKGFFGGKRDEKLLFGFDFDGKGNYQMYGANIVDDDWGQPKDPGKYVINSAKYPDTGTQYYYIKFEKSYRPHIIINTRDSFTYGEYVLYRDFFPFSK